MFARVERTFCERSAAEPFPVSARRGRAGPHGCVITVGGDQLTGKSTLVRDLLASPALGTALGEESSWRPRSSAVD